MNFVTTKQLSQLWHISSRRVLKLCEEGRLDGAVKVAGVWLIPDSISKPADRRAKKRPT